MRFKSLNTLIIIWLLGIGRSILYIIYICKGICVEQNSNWFHNLIKLKTVSVFFLREKSSTMRGKKIVFCA